MRGWKHTLGGQLPRYGYFQTRTKRMQPVGEYTSFGKADGHTAKISAALGLHKRRVWANASMLAARHTQSCTHARSSGRTLGTAVLRRRH